MKEALVLQNAKVPHHAPAICPHCFGSMTPKDAVKAMGLLICPACADGSAVWAALKEWRDSTSNQPFDVWMLESLDYEIAGDADQPGMWLWVNSAGEASELSFATREEAVADAQRCAAAERVAGGDQPWFAGLAPGDEVWWNDPDSGIASGYYHIAAVKHADDAPIGPGTVVDLQNDCGTEVEAFVSELSPSRPTETARFRLVLDVTYDLNGETAEAMQRNLHRLVTHAFGEGLLTGSSDAEVDSYTVNVKQQPEVSEDEIADWFAEQLADGYIRPSDVAVKFVRYGMMEPADFAAEMLGRIEMVKEDA